jgi:hypothetical protein
VGAVVDDESKTIHAYEIRVRPVDEILAEALQRPVEWHARDPKIERIATGVRACERDRELGVGRQRATWKTPLAEKQSG